MNDDLTRAIVEALDRRHHLNTVDLASDIAAAIAPLIVQREQRAFDRGYDKALEVRDD